MVSEYWKRYAEGKEFMSETFIIHVSILKDIFLIKNVTAATLAFFDVTVVNKSPPDASGQTLLTTYPHKRLSNLSRKLRHADN